MDFYDKERMEYKKRKMEYLHDRKPERYKLHNIGIGFIVQDTLSHEFNRSDKSDYHLIPEMNGGPKRESDMSAQDLIDEMNRLDYAVNGNLYDEDKYWVMNTKEKLYQALRTKLNDSLNNFTGYDVFDFNMANWTGDDVNQIKIKVKLWADGFLEPGSLDVFEVINKYLDEVEDSDDRDDMIRTDTLIELKMRLLESMGKNWVKR